MRNSKLRAYVLPELNPLPDEGPLMLRLGRRSNHGYWELGPDNTLTITVANDDDSGDREIMAALQALTNDELFDLIVAALRQARAGKPKIKLA